MTGSHVGGHHDLYIAASSPVHRMAAEAKLAALAVFVVAVALTPRRAPMAFLAYACLLLVAFVASGLSPRVLGRVRVVAPFVAFALFLPFVATGHRRDVLGVSLSTDGVRSAGAIIARTALGAVSAVLLTATTPLRNVLLGLHRLRTPSIVVAIIGFLFRYLDVLSEQLHSMRMAMTARGHDPRWLWQIKPIASSVGVLFVRSYERGERIHLAMAARGFQGTMPDLDDRRAGASDWVIAAVIAVACALVLIAAFVAP